MRSYAQKLKLFAGKSLLLLLVATPILATGFAGKMFVNNQAYAATSSTINFQARLMNAAGAIAPDGDYNVEFKIYDTVSTGGTAQGVCTGNCKWVETRTSGNKVHVANGYISVQLGSVTAFGGSINWDQQLWITMNIGGTSTPTWDGEMTPRLQLTAVPYAFRAGQLASLAGSNTAVLQFAASFGQNTTITLPDPGAGTATVCYQTSTACGFVTGASTDFIQNGTSVQTPANFNIRSAAAGSVTAVIQGTNGQTADILDVQTWNGTTNTTVLGVASNGRVSLLGGLNPDITTTTAATANGITLQPGVSSGASTTGAGTTIKAGDVSGTTTVTGGTLALQGGSATGGSGTRTGGDVSIDGGTGATANGNISIGTTNAPTVNIGSVGTTAKATTVHIADTSTTTGGAIQSVTIGSNSNLAHTTVIQGGNSNTAGSEAIRLVPQTAGGIAIGSTTGTGTITLGQSTAANIINIGSADFTGANTQSINIANGLQTTGASTLNVNILSNTGNGNAGTAFLRLGNNDRVQQIDIGNVVSDGNRTLNVFTGNTASGVTDTLNIGTGNAAGSKVIHIGDGTPSGSGVNTITVGSTALSSTTTVQGGTGSGAVSIQAGTSGTVSVGTANANTVNLGSSTSGTVLGLTSGSGSGNSISLKSNNATGGILVQSVTNSTSAFQVQNASGTNGILFNIDSTNGWVINNSVVHPGNLLENPSFEANGAFMLSGWNYSAQSAITVGAGNAHHGNNEMVSTPNSTAFNISSLKYLEAVPGDVYYADIWYKTAASTNGQASFSFQYYNASKTSIGSSTATVFNPANTSYTRATLYDTAPANTAYVRLSIGVDATSTTGTWYFDDMSISRVNEIGPKLFKAGANSANAFQVQDASANNYIGVDTSGATITVGYASSTTTLAGTVKVSTLGASTSNSAPVCRDTSTNTLTSCDANTTGKPFIQGGNSFGVAGDLGTNDAFALNIRTGGTTRLTVGAAGGVSLASGNALTVNSGATTLTGAATGDALTVSNSTSTGNIAVFKDNSTAVATLADGGGLLLQNATDSSSAFQVKTSAAGTNATLFGVDTASNILNMGAVGSLAVASTANIATSTGAAQTVNIGGTAGAAANNTTVLIQGGNTGAAVQIQALAGGSISIGTNNTPGSIVQIGSNSLTSGTQVINIGNNNTSGGTTDVTIGTGGSATGGATVVQAKTSLTLSTNGVGRVFMDNTATMYLGGSAASVASPNDYTIQGAGSSAATVAGAAIKIQGGTGNTTGAGGKVTIQGGTGGGSGVKGLIELNGGTFFTTGSYSSGSTATITQSLIDSNSAILASATAASLTFTVPTPTNGASQAGRVLYIVNSGANAFTLSFASSNLSLSAGATATLIWSGTAWTGAGADSATLQNDYANSLGGTTPEIILDNTRKQIDIQDANGGYVGSNAQLLAVRTGAASGLGNPLLTVTNSGGNTGTPLVGIGVETATRALHLSVNNSTTSGGPFLLENLGSGDASMEYKSTGGSFYTGIDTSDGGKYKINSSVAAGTSGTFGRTSIGGSTDSGDQNFQNASKFAMGGAAGTMSSMSVYINGGSGSNSYSVALYADNAGVPGSLITSSLAQTITPNAWNTVAITAGLSASTNYWLAFNTNDSSANMRYDNTPGVSCFISRTFALGWPASYGACTSGVGIQNFSIYATYSLNTTTDTYGSNSLFSLGNTGQATFQNFLNSTNAFQVLNSTGTTLLNVDTNTPTVNLGVTGATAQAGTVNVGTSTGATQTINIGSATTGSAANGTTVLMQGGNTSSAVSIQALASGTIGIGTNNAANTLQVGSTTLSSGTQTINIGNNNTSGGTTNVTIGSGSSATAGTTTVQGKTATNVTSNGAVTITAGAASTWSTTTGNLSIQAGASAGLLSLTGGTATGATTAGAVTMQGGAASATAGSNGGGINILGAVGSSTGTGGTGGSLLLSAGNAAGSGNNAGGNITLNLGGATGTGTSGAFFVQNSLGANLLTVDPSNTYNGLNLALNPGAEVAATFATNWTAHTGTGTPTITQDVTAGEFASGTAGVKIAATGANQGVRNNLGASLTAGTTYVVSFSAKSSTAMTDLTVAYYRNNTPTLDIACSNYSSQSIDSTAWKKISCTFTAQTAGNTTAFLAITQVASATRSIFIDNLSIVAQNNTGTSNIGDLKVGGALSQGLTLLTLDTYAGNPFSGTNSSLAGSMYFDTTSGKIQCYDGSSWGACGAAPNGIVTLTPEYAGAVLNGTGIGTMTSDFCANSGALTVGTLCGTNDARNFYKWTSPQGTAQAYSIYVTYKLPPTFKSFVAGSTSLTGLVDNTTNATVKYAIFKSTGSAITSCSALSTVVGWNGSSAVGTASTWTSGVAGTLSGTSDPSGCSFAAGNNIIFQIQVSANSNASAYAENLNFQYSNQ